MPDMVAIAVRLGLYLDLMLLFGLPMFGLYTLRGTERESGSVLRFRSVLASIALAGIGLSILGMMVLAASMGGVSVDQVAEHPRGSRGPLPEVPGNLSHSLDAHGSSR